jgi:Rrf2 family protein
MRLTSRSEYAVLALIHLGRHDTDAWVSAAKIAEAQGIPLPFLAQILSALKRARLVRSTKGQHGGFRLARAPETISLADVIRLFDGPLAPTHSASEYFYEPTPIERERKMLALCREIRDYVAGRLEQTTLADVM